jgi:hypothetical protein
MTKQLVIKKPPQYEPSHSHPKLHLVQGGGQCNSDPDVNQQDVISELHGLSHPKEVTPSFTEIATSEKSPAHLQAIEDVNQYKAGLITATELRKRHSLTYKNWDDMKQRCKGDPEKGIPPTEFHSSFVKFADYLSVAGPRPYRTWSVDRIDPTGPYSPDNCRWASKKAQSRNRTNTVYLTYRGMTRPLVEWAEMMGVSPDTLRARKREGWSDDEIIEGSRRSGYAKFTTSAIAKSRNPFDYTPWPIQHRERLENLYQRLGYSGEHRLTFMNRISKDQLSKVSDAAEAASWPDDYTPTQEEEELSQRLAQGYSKWLDVLRDAQQKLSGEYRRQLYGRTTLPDWVEDQLSSCG